MKSALTLTVLAVALTSTPLIASAKSCPPPLKNMKPGYYGHPLHHRYHQSKQVSFYTSHHEKMYPHKEQSAETSSGDKTGPQAAGTARHDVKASGKIMEATINGGSFSKLIKAIKATDLDEILEGPGPYTVVAPIVEASARIPDKVRAALNADKPALAELLSYHVIPGEVIAVDVARPDSATTVQSSVIAIGSSNGVKVDGASVVITDMRASNGIVHVIDSVLIPNRKSRSYPATPGNTSVMSDQAAKVPTVALPATESVSEYGSTSDEWRKINVRKF